MLNYTKKTGIACLFYYHYIVTLFIALFAAIIRYNYALNNEQQ
jgi:hypothetical protein